METGKAAVLNFLYRNEIKSGKVLVDGAYVSAAAGLGVCIPWITSVWALLPRREDGERTGAKVRAKTRAMASSRLPYFWRDYSWHGSWSQDTF